MNSPIFMISTGRTGTKYFADFFSTYCKEVSAHHTTRYTRILNILGNMYRRKTALESMLKAVWKLLKYNEIKSHTLRYIECNPYYYNMKNIMSHYFPDAKFVFVVRAPRSFIISHIKWERQRWQSKVANRLVPFWQPAPYVEQLKGFCNDYYQRVSFYSHVWAVKNEAIMEAVAEGEKTILVKFESLFDPVCGAQVIEDLVEWLGLELKRRITKEMVIQKINTTKSVRYEFWDEHCTDIMSSICGSLARDFGY